jgi:hypothetical protein
MPMAAYMVWTMLSMSCCTSGVTAGTTSAGACSTSAPYRRIGRITSGGLARAREALADLLLGDGEVPFDLIDRIGTEFFEECVCQH